MRLSLPKKKVQKGEKISKKLSNKVYDSMGEKVKGIDRKEFYKGMNIELEHFDLTKGDLQKTAMITLAHLRELPDYNTRLEEMEKEGRKARKRTRRRRVYRTYLFDDVDD